MKRNKHYKHMSDADLIGGYLAGDDHAFEELFGRYRPELLIFIFHKLGDWEKAEDMLQDVFTDVIKELKSHAYHENGKFRGWLFEHARNTVADEIRKLMRHPRKKGAEPEMLPDNNPTIEENIISRQEYSRLKTARKHLSSRHQREIQLRYVRVNRIEKYQRLCTSLRRVHELFAAMRLIRCANGWGRMEENSL